MSALDEVLEVGVDDYWAKNSSGVLKQAHAELAQLRAELAAANGRLARMREALKSIEYIDLDEITAFAGTNAFTYCPSCGYKNSDGHYSECKLDAALKETE